MQNNNWLFLMWYYDENFRLNYIVYDQKKMTKITIF